MKPIVIPKNFEPPDFPEIKEIIESLKNNMVAGRDLIVAERNKYNGHTKL